MPKHKETYYSPYNTIQIYEIVADIKSYPDFLPWVQSAHIITQTHEEITAELTIKFKAFETKYTSVVRLQKPKNANESGEIIVRMKKGPFKYLKNNWHFLPTDNNGTKIKFDIDFEFKSIILGKMMEVIFPSATAKMINVFNKRADMLYDKK